MTSDTWGPNRAAHAPPPQGIAPMTAREGGTGGASIFERWPSPSAPANAAALSKLGGGKNKCMRCSKSVYAAESIAGPGGEWHKQCLACNACRKLLDTITLMEHRGEVYCRACFSKSAAVGASPIVLVESSVSATAVPPRPGQDEATLGVPAVTADRRSGAACVVPDANPHSASGAEELSLIHISEPTRPY